MTDALRAEIRDPLWMLSRQWQLAEFRGDDAGSPIRADVRVEHDAVTRYELGSPSADDGAASEPRPYRGEPLEALVERERVLSHPDGPPTRLAVEAGQYFCRLLAEYGYDADDGPYVAADFPQELVLTDVEGDLDADGRRFARVTTDRTLDGAAVYDAIVAALSNLDAVAAGASPEVADADALPLPTDGDRTDAFDDAVAAFVGYYRSLFDEPPSEASDDGRDAAWRPERVEYEFAVATGEDDRETAFLAPSYDGRHLDWHAFDVAEDRTLDGGDIVERGGGASDGGRDQGRGAGREDDGATSTTSVTTLPTRARFPGMPAPRWWEFEDGAVMLEDVSGDGASLARLLLLEFAVQYGNDWFLVPVDVPVGSLSRVDSLSITDTFGVSESIDATTERTDEWNAFAFRDLPNVDGPGLLLPPTLPASIESDPVEHVVLERDEHANLGFGVEHVVEGPIGDPVDRETFEPPSLRVKGVEPAGDAAEEFATLENPGDDELDISGWEVRRLADGEESTVFAFGDDALPPSSTLRLHTGHPDDAPTDESLVRYCELSDPVWADADALTVYDAADEPRLVTLHRLERPTDAVADYRIASTVPEHWFPLDVDPTSQTEYRLERALLLDAKTLGVDAEHLPRPQGRILEPEPWLLEAGEETLRLYGEEVTRAGTEVARTYQLAGWHTGRSHLWAGRRVGTGHEQAASDLRFDFLADRGDATSGEGPSGPPIPGDALEVAALHVSDISVNEERVVLENAGPVPIDFTGWTLQDRFDEGVVDTPIDEAFVFPDGFELEPGASVTVWTGHGEDTETDLYWGLGTHLWRAEGDVVLLLDADGEVVFEHAYGDQA